MENSNKMRWWHYAGYAFGEMSYTLENTFIASYMVMYFTTAVGINALTVGTMTLICRILDAFTDVGFGMIADRTKKNRFGKFKPWYMGSLIPTAVAFIFVFTVPNSIGSGSAMAVLFMYIMYILFGSVFATVNFQWLSAQTIVCTDDPKEKRTMTTWRQWAAAVAGVIISYIGVNLILSFNMGNMMDRKGYSYTAIILSGICLILAILSCVFSKERATLGAWGTLNDANKQVSAQAPQKLSLKEEFKVFKGNKLLWGALIINVFTFMMATSTTTITSYFYTYSIGAPALIATVMTTGCIVGAIVNTIIGPILSQKLKRNALYFISGCAMLVCWLLTYLSRGNITILIIGWSFFQSAIQLFNAIIFRSIPDSVDWAEWKYGITAPGIVSSFVSFAQKIGMGISTFIVTAALTMVGYQEGVAVQSDAARLGIYYLYPILPCIFIFLTLIGFFMINSVKQEELIQMRKELNEKKGIAFDEKNAIV